MSTVRMLPLSAPLAAGFLGDTGAAFLLSVAALLLTILLVRVASRRFGNKEQ